MEEFFQSLGVIGLIILLVVGVLAGVIASAVEGGRNKGRNTAIGIVRALLLPFLVALVAAGALATGGLLLIPLLALIGAMAVLLIARLISCFAAVPLRPLLAMQPGTVRSTGEGCL